MYVNDTAKMIQIWSNTNTQSANLLKNLLKKKMKSAFRNQYNVKVHIIFIQLHSRATAHSDLL